MLGDGRCIFTPISSSSSIRAFTSAISGTLVNVTCSSVSSAAHSTCSASFLAPCGTIVPFSARPPRISKASMRTARYKIYTSPSRMTDINVLFRADFSINGETKKAVGSASTPHRQTHRQRQHPLRCCILPGPVYKCSY